MKIDPRCKRLNELNDRYHQLLRQVAEGLLKRHCQESSYPEELCIGDYALLYQVGEGGGQAARSVAAAMPPLPGGVSGVQSVTAAMWA